MRFFFVLSLGRTGTQMFSRLLNSVDGVEVRHEPCPEDVKLLGLRRAGNLECVLDGMLHARFMSLGPKCRTCDTYGEVNSYLRYEASWLKRELNADLVFMCRDGRDFVRSAYQRVVYTPVDVQIPILPTDDDPASRLWSSFDRFEKLCWYWMHTNEMLLESVGAPVKMELALTNYDYFSERILSPLRLELDATTWVSLVDRPMNTREQSMRKQVLARIVRFRKRSSVSPLAHWSEWSDELTNRFWSIAGTTMSRLGYAEQ